MKPKVVSFSDAKDRGEGFERASSCKLRYEPGRVFLEIGFSSREGFVVKLTPDEALMWASGLRKVASAAISSRSAMAGKEVG